MGLRGGNENLKPEKQPGSDFNKIGGEGGSND